MNLNLENTSQIVITDLSDVEKTLPDYIGSSNKNERIGFCDNSYQKQREPSVIVAVERLREEAQLYSAILLADFPCHVASCREAA